MEHNNMDKLFIDFLDAYNQAFYDKDINKLKEFYDSTNNILIYFDNHKNNDTYCLEEHLRLISDFFKNGKATESGGVEPLISFLPYYSTKKAENPVKSGFSALYIFREF